MRSHPIEPAEITLDADGTPRAERFDDIYHPRAGARQQAEHVFLHGNGLPGRWQGRERFVVVETGFGLGHNFLATWQAWRDDPRRGGHLVFVSVELHPPRREDLQRVHAGDPLAARLVDGWPPALHGLHTLRLEPDGVTLMLALGDVAAWLPELEVRADAFFLDGFAPDRNPRMWQPRVFASLARLAAPGATAATWSAARAVRDGLASAGFAVERAPGRSGKRDITVARFEPRFAAAPPPGRRVPAADRRHAIVVGAGIAGSATAAALAQQGWTCEVFDRAAEPASEASGNAGGIFRPVLTRDDGAHARWYRAAAFEAAALVRRAVVEAGVPGAVDGLLWLGDAEGDVPLAFAQRLDAKASAERAGIALPRGGWWFEHAGWVEPPALARALLAKATLHRGVAVAAIERHATDWRVLDADGGELARAPVLVLANAGDALRLLGEPGWPMRPRRGQVSIASGVAHGLRVPVSGHGYAVPIGSTNLLFGATNQRDDDDPTVREADHAANRATLAALTGLHLDAALPLAGRTGWRWTTTDRLPVIGAVPDSAATGPRREQPRFVARREGLYVITGLGSRGLSSAALGARVLAALVTGAPCPVESSLLDAIDPARFVSRAVRRGGADQTAA